MQKKPPLILTLSMDSKSQAFFNSRRILYYPPGRNVLNAHLTLFHQLPNEPGTYDFLAGLQKSSFQLQVVGLINLGSGVAYKIESAELQSLRKKLEIYFLEQLIPQDRQPYRPHVTIMNKRTPESTRGVMKDLSTDFNMFSITGMGLDLWAYLDGPWQHEVSFHFHPPDRK